MKLCATSLVLYIFWFLHQTTTYTRSKKRANTLYIFWFLHQTTTHDTLSMMRYRCISFDSYIKPQLRFNNNTTLLSCISFDSYIKPQLMRTSILMIWVVYLLIPTSNHNPLQNKFVKLWLYIFWFLHQTTTVVPVVRDFVGCISFDSYIKPQQKTIY